MNSDAPPPATLSAPEGAPGRRTTAQSPIAGRSGPRADPRILSARPLPLIDRLTRRRIPILIASIAIFVITAAVIFVLPKPTPDAVVPAPSATPAASASPTPSSTAAAATGSLSDTVDGQAVRLEVPETSPIGLAVFFHGAGGDAGTLMDSPWLGALVDAGWAVASWDFHGNAWGSPATTTDLQSLSTWAETQVGMAPSLLVADSMGALTSLNAIVRGANLIPCWYGVESVADLRTVGNVTGSQEEIAAAYGGTPAAADNPILNLETLASADTTYRVVGAGADTLIPNDENSVALSDGLAEAGAVVTYLQIDADHGDAALFDSADLVGFAEGCSQ